jgi:hypothetical protein
MRAIHKGKKQAYGDGIGPAASDSSRYPLEFGSRGSKKDSARAVQPLAQPKPPRSRNERLRLLKQQIVKLRPSLPPNLQNVLKTRGRDESHAPALSLQQRVGANGSAADQLKASQVGAGFANSAQRIRNRLRRLSRVEETFRISRRPPRR